jgi:CAAX protease family protein
MGTISKRNPVRDSPRDEGSTDSAVKYSTRKLTAFGTVVALIVLPSFIPIFTAPFYAFYRVAASYSLVAPQSELAFWEFINDLLITLTIIAIARYWEKETWSSVGITRFSLADLFLGVATFLIYYLIPLGWMMGKVLHAGVTQGAIHTEFWFLASVASSVFFEELANRAYIIERVIAFTGSRLLAGIASLLLSITLHIPGRTLGGALQRGPVLLLLTVLYIWRRNVVACLVAHFLINAMLILVLSHDAGWLVRWLFLPSRSWITLLVCGILYLILRRLADGILKLRAE